jgi:dTDP-4-dehydrorhamnose reductase
MRIVVLGSGGFVGRYIVTVFKEQKKNYLALTRNEVDFLDENSFPQFQLKEDDIIIDCISVIDGDAEKINATNVTGLTAFLNYINSQHKHYQYIYLSTFSTTKADLVQSHIYVHSKFVAEDIIRKSVPNYKIIRLLFPFGKGEGQNRLISRLIQKVKRNESLEIDRMKFNPTPVEMLAAAILDAVNNHHKEMTICGSVAIELAEIAESIYKKLGRSADYKVTDRFLDLTAPSTVKLITSKEKIFEAIDAMI